MVVQTRSEENFDSDELSYDEPEYPSRGAAHMSKEKLHEMGRKGGSKSRRGRQRGTWEGDISEEVYSEEEGESEEDEPELREQVRKRKRGTAVMPKEKVREMGRKGGKIGGKRSHGYYGDTVGGEERPREYRKGFHQMDRERVTEIGRKGGKRSHGSRGKLTEEEYQRELDEFSDEAGFGEGEELESYKTQPKGAARMPKEKVREMGRKGGKIGGKRSHGFSDQYYSDEELYPEKYRRSYHEMLEEEGEGESEEEEQVTKSRRGKSRRGFAAMPQEKQRAIASKGGKSRRR